LNSKLKVLLIISIILLFGTSLKVLINYTPAVVFNYVNNDKIENPLNTKIDSVEQNGAWIEYSYQLNTKKDMNMTSEKFLEGVDSNFFNHKKELQEARVMKFNKISETQKKVCLNKKLNHLIKDKGAGVRIKYFVKDKPIFNVDVIPYTCEIMDNLREKEREIMENKNEK